MTGNKPQSAPMSSAEFRTLPEACGLTLVAVSRMLAVKVLAVQRWESGGRGISSDIAINIRFIDGLIRERVTAVRARYCGNDTTR